MGLRQRLRRDRGPSEATVNDVNAPSLRVRDFVDSDLDAVVALWHRAKRRAYPYLPLEQARTLEDDCAFFRDSILRRCRVWVCEEDGAVRGFLAMAGSYIDRLYVDPDAQRRGVGTSLMDVAFR